MKHEDYTGARPLEDPPFTMMHNYLFDVAMPKLSPNAWKVICHAVRQTRGYADPNSPTGRKISDVISYSQFMEGTGIGGRSTLSKAIKECLDSGYLLRTPAGMSRGRPIYAYRLNTKYRVLEQDSTTDRVLKQDSATDGANVQNQDPIESQSRTDMSPKTGLTKERNKKQTVDDVVSTTDEQTLIGLGIAPALAAKILESRGVDWIAGHLAYLETPEGQEIRIPAAYLTYAHNENVPVPTNGRSKPDPSQDRNRFISGEFAEYIQH